MKLQAKRGTMLAGALLLLTYAASLGLALSGDASVADEHPHLLSGLLYWTSGQFAGGLDNPPLGQLLVAAPLYLFRVDYLFPSDQVLWLARLPVLLLALALALLMARWVAVTQGARCGLMVLLCFCLEPNLLAHGHYATLDLPVTLFWWLTLWSWRHCITQQIAAVALASRLRAAALFASLFSLTVLTKFTGLFLVPICLLVAMLALRTSRQRLEATTVLLMAVVCLLLLSHVAYGFESTRYGLPAQFVEALQGKWTHRGEGHFAFLAGKRSREGFPEYYLVTVLLKTPIPLLLLAALGCVLGWRRQSRIDRSVLIVPGVFLLLVFSWIRVNIGVRHVLPLYPAMLFFAAVGVQQLARRGRIARALLTTLVLCWTAGVAQNIPHAIGYFNVLGGGAAGGHRWLLDSNLDWGQDDRRLESFLRQAATRGETWQVNPDGNVPRLGKTAVNANVLHNLLRMDDRPFAWLRSMEPRRLVGVSWRLYDLDVGDFERRAARLHEDAEAQIAYARILRQQGEGATAQRVLREAAERMPDDPRIAHAAGLDALEREEFREAERWVRRGLSQHATNIPLQLLGGRLSLEKRRRAAHNPLERAQADLALGMWWADQRQVELGLPYLESAARTLPDDPEAQRAYGVALARRGEFAAALGVFGQAPVADALRAESAACRRLLDAEARLARSARGGVPVPEELLFDLAQVHFEDERYDRAATALTRLLSRNARSTEALALLCEMQVRSKLRVVEARLTPRRVIGGGPQ